MIEKTSGSSAPHAIALSTGSEPTTELMKESQIERAVCNYASSVGMLAYKFTSPGRRGVPDRLFITDNGRCFFIEFKTPTGKLSPLQINEHKILRQRGVDVYTVYDVVQGKDVIDGHV